MRTTRKTGTLWFMRNYAELNGLKIIDNDGEYLFPAGRMIKISSLSQQFRDWYAYQKRIYRLNAMNREIALINKNWIRYVDPVGREINRDIFKRKCQLHKSAVYLKNKIDTYQKNATILR